MASELYVETLKGLTSGANANKVIIPSGQTLDASAGGFTTPAGHVIQVVQATSNTNTGVTSSSWTQTTITQSITPTSSSSKILVVISFYARTSAAGVTATASIFRNNTTNLSSENYGFGGPYNPSNGIETQIAIQYLDSPATTSATTYTLYGQRRDSAGTATFGESNRTSTITLMEIAG